MSVGDDDDMAFQTTVDAFTGNSGGGVFNDIGIQVGILARAPDHFVETDNDCNEYRELPESRSVHHAGIHYLEAGLHDLCDHVQWPSERLCDRGTVCGDGICNGSEGAWGQCEEDCLAPTCGDGVCNLGEDAAGCIDCPLGGGDAPREWFCKAHFYNAGKDDDCECECGAYDPDCDIPDIRVLGCEDSQVCSSEGTCVSPGDKALGTTVDSSAPASSRACALGRSGSGVWWALVIGVFILGRRALCRPGKS